ncbi:MAG: signal recognition particle protein [Candidatus Eisenbacteria bacterium]|jgi:signal recognition particle subunit SRP54|nr:signal recognition particle protein [Candidatus Eisenbacteria bacterium]
MFSILAGKLEVIMKRLHGHGRLDERLVDDALRELRLALLEADVNYRVVKDFIAAIRPRALSQEVLDSVTPGQHVAWILHQEMVRLLGSESEPIRWGGMPPVAILLAGLQGSGKTTTAGKLASMLKGQRKRVLLVAADVYRPAAVEQLRALATQIGVECVGGEGDPVAICAEAVARSRRDVFDAVILDTAGRLHVDAEMMDELARIADAVSPRERLLVVDGMSGQDAVRTAQEFHTRLQLTGVILTKLDGDARGGAALSVRAVTGAPIKFVGVGEKLGDLEPFHPDRIASRILGLGDVLTLVEKAHAQADLDRSAAIQRKLKRGELNLMDFLEQLRQLKKMGSLDQLVSMIPGASKLGLSGASLDDRELARTEAIILSMTGEERAKPAVMNGSRRKRIARGSGTSVQDVNRLLREFEAMQKMMKRMGGARIGRRVPLGRLN